MREIKFRAWINIEEYKGYYYPKEDNDYISFIIYQDEWGIVDCNYEWLNDNEFIIEQFTGLHDKNGKEIYENDIIFNEEENKNVIIKWWNEASAFFMCIGREGVPISWITEKNICLSEIVGNIHENPELIK